MRATSPGAAPVASVGRAIGREVIDVRGSLAAGARATTTVVAVPDPALFAARVFAAKLRDAGIEVAADAAVARWPDEPFRELPSQPPSEPPAPGSSASARTVGPFRDRAIAVVESPPVHELLGPTLGASDNLYAEQLARVAARVATGDGSTASMQRHGLDVLRKLGIDTAGMVLADGSGLSRRNLVHPRQLAQLLVAMHRSPHREPFVAALPLAGRSGTLRNRFTGGPAHGRVRAKTGFISRVVCLSGYVPRPEPELAPLVFSVMLNDFTCDEAEAKAAVDAFVQRLALVAGR
jgi:D-alanyl-D-alanine carboxypeptidase